MSKEILQDIIDSFAPDKFSRFFRDKNRLFSPRQEDVRHYDDENFKNGLKLGEIQFTKTEKLIVCAFQVKQSLSERSGKKAQYEKGKKILKDTQSDAGIFIFYDQTGNFRFSLIYPETIGNRRQWSSFRRFTYFVSREFTNKTFLQRIGDNEFSSIEKIKDAFSVEKVTKEFYEAYRRLFEALYSDLNKNWVFKKIASENEINTVDFAKKLLGQIVFLYFLQKKGWLGVPQDKTWGDGDKNFISNLYKQASEKKSNFFNDYLEILFYDTLNNARRECADPSFSQYFKCRIPFLNGGLFEPEYDWRGTKVYLENSIFKNIIEVFDRYNFTVEEESPEDKEVAIDPEMLGKVFENLLEENLRKGKGAYYTPREIVHYMCQESLINYLLTETKMDVEKIRKLVIFRNVDLTIDETTLLKNALLDMKACDPACGSGAFLVGMLYEIVSARRVLEPEKTEYKLKKESIQNCIYGVDIDPGAVEIAKLRLWLSLVVDYELEDIEPLPNLDYKIMCGNSLLEDLVVGDEAIKLFDDKLLAIKKQKGGKFLFGEKVVEDKTASARIQYLRKLLLEKQKELVAFHNQLTFARKKELEKELSIISKELKPKSKRSKSVDYHPSLFIENADKYFVMLKDLHVQYFSEHDPSAKKEKRRQIENIELEFIKSSVQEKIDNIDTKIKNLNMQDSGDRKLQAVLMKKKLEYMAIFGQILRSKVRPYFLWKLNFFEIFQENGGFDVMIANPPYLKERDNKNVFDIVNRSEFGDRYHQGKMDYWYYFLHKAIDLTRPDGIISYITSRYWLNSSGSRKLIQRIQSELSFINVVDIGKLKVFDEVSGHHMVAVYQKNKLRDKFVCKKLENDISDIDKSKDTENVKIQFLSSDTIFHDGEIMLENEGIKLTDTIKLGVITDISQGVVQNPDKVSKKAAVRFKLIPGLGVFVINKKELASLSPLSVEEKRVIRNFFDERDIGKYTFDKSNKKYLIYITKMSCPDIQRFPHIKEHLIKYKKIMDERRETRKGTIKWFQLHWPREERYFESAKIVLPSMFKEATATYIAEPAYFGISTNVVILRDLEYDLKYILAIINSKLGINWFYKYGKNRGAGVDIGVEKLRSFPVKKTSSSEQKPFIEMVDKIMLITNDTDYSGNEKKQAKVKDYEREIDQMVYKLYGLTKEEIDVIEKSSS